MEHESVNAAPKKTLNPDRNPLRTSPRPPSPPASHLRRLHQSIGNRAVGTLLQRSLGETVRLPVMADVVQSPTVESARRADWEEGVKDYMERGAWIFWQGSPPYDREKGEKRDDVRGSYDIRPWNMAVGALDDDPSSDPRDVIDPGNPPANDSLSFLVGHYHQHPPLDPSMNRDPVNFPVGPSENDRHNAKVLGNPGIVRDFTDTDRTVVTDYRYGPSEQTSR